MASSTNNQCAWLHIFFLLLVTTCGALASLAGEVQESDYLNATVFQVIPALQTVPALGNSAVGTYNISTGVRQFVNHSGKYSVQTFWMTSDPPVTDLDTLPFWACAVVPITNSTVFTGTDPHNKGCSVALPSGCEDALVAQLQSNAHLPGPNPPWDDYSLADACLVLGNRVFPVPSECAPEYEWERFGGNPLSKELYNIDFTNPDGWSLGYRSPDYNPFIGSFNSNTLASYIFKNDDGDPGTDWYKHMLNTSTTLVLAAWPESPTGDWKLDVRVACLTTGAGVLLGSEGPNSSPHVTALSIPAQVLMLFAVVLAVV